jgi:hypothetical protein
MKRMVRGRGDHNLIPKGSTKFVAFLGEPENETVASKIAGARDL